MPGKRKKSGQGPRSSACIGRRYKNNLWSRKTKTFVTEARSAETQVNPEIQASLETQSMETQSMETQANSETQSTETQVNSETQATEMQENPGTLVNTETQGHIVQVQ